ncbi:MAG: hypothetical protein JO170_06575 [Verrucomicrobia bacterium]|nr:hypothetical protein [Verrucomicrobiota bacterium]
MTRLETWSCPVIALYKCLSITPSVLAECPPVADSPFQPPDALPQCQVPRSRDLSLSEQRGSYLCKDFFPLVDSLALGSEGAPLLPQSNPFRVVLELNSESPSLTEKPFEIVGTDNVRRKWTGTDTTPIGVVELPLPSQSKGQLPRPHS